MTKEQEAILAYFGQYNDDLYHDFFVNEWTRHELGQEGPVLSERLSDAFRSLLKRHFIQRMPAIQIKPEHAPFDIITSWKQRYAYRLDRRFN